MSMLTLRFRDQEVEAAYTAKLQGELLRPMLISSILVSATLCSLEFDKYQGEAQRSDLPFRWGAGDPRTLYFATHLVVITMNLVVAFLISLRLFSGRLHSLNWEFLSAFTVAYFVSSLLMMSTWHTAMMFGKVPEKAWREAHTDSEFRSLLETIAIVAASCMYLPIRTSILWIVPVCALGSYIAVVLAVGSQLPASTGRIITYQTLLGFFFFQGARRHEREDREKWYSVQRMSNETVELKDVKQAYQQVASVFCESVVKLSSNGCVEDSDRTHTAFFGRSMEGQQFSGALHPEDREAFSELLQQASVTQEVQSMPARLDLNFNRAKAQLIVVDTNVTHARHPSWLVGVHSVELDQSSQASEIDYTMMSTMVANRRQQESDVDQESRWESLPSTTHTGRVFKGIDREGPLSFEDSVQQRLESIAEMGSKEHWLIRPSELALLPEMVLGSGGFGVVVAGKLRGTPVAVKLPKWSMPGRHLSILASISNELRLLRYIRHPNIVLWHGSCIDPQSGHLALIYELVSGVQLDAYVNKDLSGVQGLRFRHKLLVDMACALLYLHSHNPVIVHGDLKTSNVLVERWASGPRAKMLDFGLSRLLTKRAESLGGTLEWVAPEVLLNSRSGSRRVLASADVFSYGRLAYFVCTGLRPLGAYQEDVVLQMARQRRPVPLRWAPGTPFLEQCRALCDACLSHEPACRPSIAKVKYGLASWLPAPGAGRGGAEDFYSRVDASPGTGWCDGLKSIEGATGQEFSSYTVSAGAKDRGEMMLDALESLIQASPEPGQPHGDRRSPGLLDHGHPPASGTCSNDPGTCGDHEPAASCERQASLSL